MLLQSSYFLPQIFDNWSRGASCQTIASRNLTIIATQVCLFVAGKFHNHTSPSSATIEGSVPCVMTTTRLCVPHALGNAANFKAITSISSVCNMETGFLNYKPPNQQARCCRDILRTQSSDRTYSILNVNRVKLTSQPRTEEIVLASVSFPKRKST
jgi:hypothetical protein